MSIKVEVSLDDLIAMWVDRHCEDIAPDCNTYYHDGFQDVVVIEFTNEQTEHD